LRTRVAVKDRWKEKDWMIAESEVGDQRAQVNEGADEAGISERTVKRSKKRGGGSVTYRESKAGEGRGAGRWM
jgi:hypothetical protein